DVRMQGQGMLLAINAEFVDATELWWAIHKEEWNWYLNPALRGRPEHLRVLAWTGGGLPMIWFAVVPDAALKTLEPAAAPKDAGGGKAGKEIPSTQDQPAADIVFFRPPPGINAFPYNPNADGRICSFMSMVSSGATLTSQHHHQPFAHSSSKRLG